MSLKEFQIALQRVQNDERPKDFKGDVILLVPFRPFTLDLNQENPHEKKTKRNSWRD